MPGWTLIDTHPTQGRIFRRPLDLLEQWFLWNGLFNGAADGLQHNEIRLLNASQDAHLFSEGNVVKAWLSTKRRYPLAGAAVRGVDNAPLRPSGTTDLTAGNDTGFVSAPNFFLREHDLAVLRPREIVFGSVSSAEEASRLKLAIMDGPRLISEDLLTRLYVFCETNPKGADTFHLIVLSAHYVSDRVGINTFIRCFLDTLARDGGPEPAQVPLEERLARMAPSMDYEPQYLRSLSPAIRRWRRAVGAVIFQLRMARRQGGHTLPCRLTRSTPYEPARSSALSTSLTHAQTGAVMANCRLHGVPFGNAFLALAQVAMTRALYRRYLRDEISEEEWTHRKRQPHISGGPLNMRPYLDNGWLARGGAGESILSIGLFFYQLPFMTLGVSAGKLQRVLSDGAPPFSNLLTFDRFLHRAELVQKQATAFSNHPLFFDIMHACILAETERIRLNALEWMKRVEAADSRLTQSHSDDEILAATDIPMIWAFGGSSAGSLDSMCPTEYPLPPTHPLSPYSPVPHPLKAGYVTPPPSSPPAHEAEVTPKIALVSSKIHLRGRPAEFYLTADSLNGQLSIDVIFDRNVFDEGVIREWLDEVRGAILWYLGQRHRSRRTRRRSGVNGVGDGRNKYGEGVRAKL